MPERALTFQERQVIGRCLYEAANGEYFPDWEFETLMGCDRTTVKKAASNWLTNQRISHAERSVTRSVLNNLLGYPHGYGLKLERAIGVRLSGVEALFEKLKI